MTCHRRSRVKILEAVERRTFVDQILAQNEALQLYNVTLNEYFIFLSLLVYLYRRYGNEFSNATNLIYLPS